MRCGRFATVLEFALLLAASALIARAQRAGPAPGEPTAAGQFAVSATVMASAGIAVGPDGRQRVIMANAADPPDEVVSAFMRAITIGMTGKRSTTPPSKNQDRAGRLLAGPIPEVK